MARDARGPTPEWGDLRAAVDVIIASGAATDRHKAEELFCRLFAGWGERGHGRYWRFPTPPGLERQYAGTRWLQEPRFDFDSSRIALPHIPGRVIGYEDGDPRVFDGGLVQINLEEVKGAKFPSRSTPRKQPADVRPALTDGQRADVVEFLSKPENRRSRGRQKTLVAEHYPKIAPLIRDRDWRQIFKDVPGLEPGEHPG